MFAWTGWAGSDLRRHVMTNWIHCSDVTWAVSWRVESPEIPGFLHRLCKRAPPKTLKSALLLLCEGNLLKDSDAEMFLCWYVIMPSWIFDQNNKIKTNYGIFYELHVYCACLLALLKSFILFLSLKHIYADNTSATGYLYEALSSHKCWHTLLVTGEEYFPFGTWVNNFCATDIFFGVLWNVGWWCGKFSGLNKVCRIRLCDEYSLYFWSRILQEAGWINFG